MAAVAAEWTHLQCSRVRARLRVEGETHAPLLTSYTNGAPARHLLESGLGNTILQKASAHIRVRGTYRCTRTRPVAPRIRIANWEPSRPRT